MPSAVRAITRVQDADDFSGSLTDTYIPAWSNSQQKFVMTAQATTSPGGSTGYIQYNNAGAFGASGVYWDSANSRVGIGTASPTGKLEISSASSVVVRYLGSSATDYRNEYYRNGSRIGLFSWDTGLFGLEADSANSVAIRFVTGGSERLRINSSGNVGIGTTSPGQKLDVNGSVNVTTALIVPVVRPAADSTTAFKIKTAADADFVTFDTIGKRIGIYAGGTDTIGIDFGAGSTTGWSFGKTSAGYMALVATSGSASMTITSTGLFGINRTPPGATLDAWQLSNGQTVLRSRRATDTSPTGDFINFQRNAGTKVFHVDILGNMATNGDVDTTVNAFFRANSATQIVLAARNSTGASADLFQAILQSDIQFAIGSSGRIKTNQATTNTNTPSGATAKAMPFYDAAGTLLGFVPIYASQW